jgi:hypothetical protein
MAADETCQKCGKTISRKAVAHVWQGDKVICTACRNLVRGVERRLQAAYRIAGKPDMPWYVQDGKNQQGPFGTRILIQMLANKQIDWEWSIWREGMIKSVPVARLFTIPELCNGRIELRDFGQGDGTFHPGADSFRHR